MIDQTYLQQELFWMIFNIYNHILSVRVVRLKLQIFVPDISLLLDVAAPPIVLEC